MEVHVGLAEQEKRANLEPFRQFQVLPIPFPPFEKNDVIKYGESGQITHSCWADPRGWTGRGFADWFDDLGAED